MVALRDLGPGEAVTIDYCPYSASAEHRAAVLAPFLLGDLAAGPLYEEIPDEFPEFIPPERDARVVEVPQ